MNKGYLTAKRSSESDEVNTPKYAVLPIVKYIPREWVIWCPFDKEESEYVIELKKNGNKVIFSHIENGEDFFSYEPAEYDAIVSNPPYSQKDKVLKRLAELNKPFAMLLPLPTLQGVKRFKYLKGTQALIFNKRIQFKKMGGVSFATIYICKKILPKDLIFEELRTDGD